jgi:tRNA modification GTPase
LRPNISESDTIAAIATPLGEGSLAVLRISGAQALTVAERVFRPAGTSSQLPTHAPSHSLHYGYVMREGQRIDEVLLSVMRAPRTFTREDVVEISCHGGVFGARQVLDAVLAAGARLAEPGEFTRRAFLNGRIDLAQAEAIADLIHARTELALAAANEQLAGSLSKRVNAVRDDLMTALAHIEAHLDFPDEDIKPDTRRQLEGRLEAAIAAMKELLATAHEGQVLRQGIRAAIIGRPNVGKSSLLNQLLARDRAIVSPIPGTTRDTIEETANVRGIPVVFVDTAGLRDTVDAIEQEGIRRTRMAASRAELILHVLDSSEPLTETDRGYLSEFRDTLRVLVLNKSDCPRQLRLAPESEAASVPVSCLTGAGMENLKSVLVKLVRDGFVGGAMHDVMINARHEDALRRGMAAADRAVAALREDFPLDLVAIDLRISAQAVGEIVGKTTTEDLLDSIFSQFCLGK